MSWSRRGWGFDSRKKSNAPSSASRQRIQENPKAYAEIAPETRRALVHVFPYGVTYREFESNILVLAVLHLHRRPDTWRQGRA